MEINSDPTEAIVTKSSQVMALVNGEPLGVQASILCSALAMILRNIPGENLDPVLQLLVNTIRTFHTFARVAVTEPVLDSPHDAASSPRQENDNAGPE